MVGLMKKTDPGRTTMNNDISDHREGLSKRRPVTGLLLKILVAVALVAAGLTAGGAPAEAAIHVDYSFDYCDWRATADDAAFNATTRTRDLNNNCRYLDADVQYTSNGSVYTRWCSSQITWQIECQEIGATHWRSLSQVQAEETWHWQSSGWWG